MAKKSMSKISKFMSYILRHRPDVLSLDLDKEGWIDATLFLNRVNEHQSWTLTMDDIQAVVDADKKQRYALRDGRIRANQGHSVDVNAVDPTPIVPPDTLYHGTTDQRWALIQDSGGLKKMLRHHVHLSADPQTAKQVGSRHRKEKLLLLHIDATAMHKAGHLFYLSENGVWLTDTVPVNFIEAR
ncbi:MAG: RNA 2'-phosphotransferase [Planctomycetota bacterium]|nr:RNA 2'-phosphotransferase [Planctomycetota bacterium]